MTPSSTTQLKDWIKNLSKEKDISANIIYKLKIKKCRSLI